MQFSDANFEQEVLKSNVPVLVDFWAEWCPPCRVMGPIVEELAHEIDGSKMKIGKLDVDANQAVSMQYGVMSIPTFIVFKEGKVVEKFAGAMSKEAFLGKISPHFS